MRMSREEMRSAWWENLHDLKDLGFAFIGELMRMIEVAAPSEDDANNMGYAKDEMLDIMAKYFGIRGDEIWKK